MTTALGPALSSDIRQRLDLYAALLAKWNPTIRLISAQDVSAIRERHIEDSLQLLPLIPEGIDGAIDLGSGGGLPGIVLALASGIHFDLVESDLRKAAFLREAAGLTGAPVTIHAARIEALTIPPSALITARALAPLPKLLALAYPLLAPGGICLFPKGERAEAELQEAEEAWSMHIDSIPSRTAPQARLLLIRDLHPKRQIA
ncbi:16S rRNA (guanine(527)-N(7))-methyltransferase RsmG [Acidisoma cellulosilytica]|uniref:Ribosomal RNA small subunit methyltransferase G n=1 Tax=Acidisoma cellulosilyticum TaxID=2802395 RepID=A0A964E436_9PROT|nr:16S rRNA (guanine(527)-N(7))-methyltransferase RsmG [Acidisoma cellulosilyticum]MCB8880877.1 16S rRNA (guanine(527)-N(7))-methyltransferase RsmG [Acidisoma cellulosilyticum]